MNVWIPFLQGFLFSLSLCLDLGLVNVAILKTGIEQGFRPSFAIGFGSCFGDLFYITLALIGVSVIFEITWVKRTLWIVGTIVLLLLTVKMLRDSRKPRQLPAGDPLHPVSESRSLLGLWLTGAGLTLASPTAIAWFALVAGPIVSGMNIGRGAGLIAFVSGFFAAGLLWSLSLAWIGSTAGSRVEPGFMRVLSVLSALLFLYFAIRVFWDGWLDIRHTG